MAVDAFTGFISNAGFMIGVTLFAFFGWFFVVAISYASNTWLILWILLIIFTILDTYSLVEYYDKKGTIPIWDKISPIPPTSIVGPRSYIAHILAKVLSINMYMHFNTLAVPTSTRLNVGFITIDSSNTFYGRWLYILMIFQKQYTIPILLAGCIEIIVAFYLLSNH